MNFVIDRSKWICGSPSSFETSSMTKTCHGEGGTKLLNKMGFQCCLGQIASQLGCDNDSLLERFYPFSVQKLKESILVTEKGKVLEDSQLAEDAMQINDDINTSLEEKEKSLICLFAKYGHQITFVGKYVCFSN